ncbi:hypothetical protein [Streptomyces sp. NPDC096934]|uniref:hypothetical protein n=1 Tax=Streptomyces sp. NPDC096934 TaxID=3155551 RepID=UPI00332AD9F8
MNEEDERRKPTPPSEAPGESGDKEARQEAENAVVPGSRDREDTKGRSRDTDADGDDKAGSDEHHTKRSE